jgi:transcriptional regulator with XRE-family HTH domain
MDLHVAARLKRRRLRLELEPQLLDVAIGEPSGTVERVERGDKRLGASQLYKLAVVLGVGVAYFFADDLDDEDRKVSKLPKTDHKALSEAKRFARAYAQITSPEIRLMIRDLLRSLVVPLRRHGFRTTGS